MSCSGEPPLTSSPKVNQEISRKKQVKMSNHGDIETEGISYSERQERVFEMVDSEIRALGNGLTKELAKSQGAQLVDNIKSVEMLEPRYTSDKDYGRKLCTNIKTMFKFVLGSTLEIMVETNYPLDRFIRKKHREIRDLEADLKEKERSLASGFVLEPSVLDVYMARAQNDYVEAMVRRPVTRSAKAVRKTDIEFEESETAETADKIPSRHASPTGLREDHSSEPVLSYYQDRMRRQYTVDHDEYRKRLTDRGNYNLAKARFEDSTTRCIVIVTILEGVRSAMTTIVNKIKASVAAGHDRVKAKLCGMIKVEKTGELIVNPFETNNLSGIYHILRVEYYTATLVQFNRDFSDLLRNPFSTEELIKDPIKATLQVDKKVAEWMLMNYSKFMTVDVFMVNILLSYLPPSPFKDRCVVAVTEYIQGREENLQDTYATLIVSGVDSMPIYQFLVDFMKVQHNSVGYLQFGANHSRGKNPQNPRNNTSTAAGYESAYGASELTASPFPEHLYQSEITPDRKIMCADTDTGRIVLYTATKDMCAVCHGKSTGAKVEAHSPRCYRKMCYKCHLFGHKNVDCRQHSSTYVKQQPKNA